MHKIGPPVLCIQGPHLDLLRKIQLYFCWFLLSLPSRGAWIEISQKPSQPSSLGSVAPLAGSVDRNYTPEQDGLKMPWVAPLAGSVDRNENLDIRPITPEESLPSRGAWIEIARRHEDQRMAPVAPLAGSVDRNWGGNKSAIQTNQSLPSRGAWIEMCSTCLRGWKSRSLPSRGAWIEI